MVTRRGASRPEAVEHKVTGRRATVHGANRMRGGWARGWPSTGRPST